MAIFERSWPAILAAGLLTVGCDGPVKLSSAPEGITIFEHKDYLGKSLTLDRDQRDLKNIKGPCLTSQGGGGYPTYAPSYHDTWDDCISSIRVPPGWIGTAFEEDGYKGVSVNLTEDIPNLEHVAGRSRGNMNDKISSIRISRQ